MIITMGMVHGCEQGGKGGKMVSFDTAVENREDREEIPSYIYRTCAYSAETGGGKRKIYLLPDPCFANPRETHRQPQREQEDHALNISSDTSHALEVKRAWGNSK
jgi:hypothetical protein